MEAGQMFAVSSGLQAQGSNVDEADELRSEAQRLQHLAEKLEMQAAALEKFRLVGQPGVIGQPLRS
jgi:hypothetical protein